MSDTASTAFAIRPGRVYVIAEAGVNHNGSLELAQRLVDIAADAGADAVKFQTFRAEELAGADAPKAEYQKRTSGAAQSQLEMLRALELGREAYEELRERCTARGLAFLSTAFDAASLDMLLDMGMQAIKVPSGEITNLPLLRHIGARAGDADLPVILSTGMCTLDEVGDAVGALTRAGTPRGALTLLHCNTQYPTPFEDANLLAMRTLAEAFPGCAVGYSDHTPGIPCAIAAAALGAAVVEKHCTLDRSMPGPDHAASIEPDELAEMVAGIRAVELALGTGEKAPTASERGNIAVARRHLVAARAIAAGEAFSPDNVAARRTKAGGLSPMRWDDVMGTAAPRAFAAGEAIEL